MPATRMTARQTVSALTLIVVLAAVPKDSIAQSTKTASAESFAQTVLNIYRTKDVPKLLALSPDGPPPANVLQRYAPGTGRYNSLFSDSSWRWTAVRNWKGKIDSVRYDRNALVEFATDQSSGNKNFVSLHLQDGKWKFEWMTSPAPQSLARRHFNPVTAEHTDATMVADLKAAAINVLRAFQARDVDAVLNLSVAEGPLELQFLSDDELKKPKSDFLFSAEQMSGVTDWDGQLGTVYLRETAQAEFGRAGSEVFVVTMPRVGENWKFDDIHSPDVKDFEALSPAKQSQ